MPCGLKYSKACGWCVFYLLRARRACGLKQKTCPPQWPFTVPLANTPIRRDKGQMGHIHGQKQMIKHTRSSASIALTNLARSRQEQYRKGMAKKSSGCEVFRFSYMKPKVELLFWLQPQFPFVQRTSRSIYRNSGWRLRISCSKRSTSRASVRSSIRL